MTDVTLNQSANASPEPEDRLIVGITIFTAVLSTFGSVLILLTYLRFKKIRNYAFKLIVYLSISDLILTVGGLLSLYTYNSRDNDIVCLTQSFLYNIGGLSSIIWTSIIAWNIYSATVLGAKKKAPKNIKYLLLGYCLPAAISFM